MEQFNISAIIEHYGLSQEEIAPILFPNVKYPNMAFARVLKGEANLDSEQLGRLASFIGVLVSDLYTIDDWRGSTEDNCLVFIKGEYKVRVNYAGALAIIYKNNKAVQQLIIDAQSIKLSNFISLLNNTINSLEDGTN